MTIAPEHVTTDTPAFVMPILSTVHHSGGVTVDSLTVVDNPAVAWANNQSGVLNQLHPDLVFDYRAELDAVAELAIVPLLAQVWAEVFAADRRAVNDLKLLELLDRAVPTPTFELVWGTEDDVLQGRYRIRNDRDTYHAVWDEAASRVDVDALVTAARLDDLRRTTYSD